MKPYEKELTVTQAAEVCGVGRSTINYWIKKKKIHANRHGNKYLIPVKELALLLKSRGETLPDEIQQKDHYEPIFRGMLPCWEYWNKCSQEKGCKGCVVFNNKLEICFHAKITEHLHCGKECNTCQYYLEIYYPRIRFIHQFEVPAAIFRGFYFLGGNRKWAELCEVPVNELFGMGIEDVVHADSLEMMISNIKKARLGETIPASCSIFLKNRLQGKLKVPVSFFPLKEPAGTFLMCCG